jgi:hypothetical protein
VNPPSAGLAANLDKLSSYRFSEVIYSVPPSLGDGSAAPSASGAVASVQSVSPSGGQSAMPSGDAGSLRVEGIVVNGNSKSIQIAVGGIEYVVIGSSAWNSIDGGASWQAIDGLSSVLAMLPSAYYAIWFEPHVAGFGAVGDEARNGIPCTHYSGSRTLGNLYASITGAGFQAELWVAVDGAYPVGGSYVIPGGGSSSGYSFEITNVNDATNLVTAPTNVVALPS